MLYITTRNDKDTFTSHKTLCSDFAPDLGQFVPFSLPVYNREELLILAGKGFGDIVAEIINRFFSARLSGTDVDFAIGRNAAKLVTMNHKIAVAELWRNPDGEFSYIVNSLYEKVICGSEASQKPTVWFKIAVRIAILFGVFGSLMCDELLMDSAFDISVSDDEFSLAVAAVYARKMGLPIDKIICTTDDSVSLWDFIQRGTFSSNKKQLPIYSYLEMLVNASLGTADAVRFGEACEKGELYSLDEEQLPVFNNGLFCSVTSHSRTESTINSVYRSNGYILESKAAFCYGGLQDYRAKTGDGCLTLILAEKNPTADAQTICSATGIEKRKLIEHINFT